MTQYIVIRRNICANNLRGISCGRRYALKGNPRILSRFYICIILIFIGLNTSIKRRKINW